MLNSIIPQNDIEDNQKTTLKKFTDYEFDEATGQMTGKLATGNDALKGWIYFALRIARYKYPIYSWYYGSELDTLIGDTMDNDELQMQVARYVEEALLINPYIKEIDNVIVEKVDEKLSISCEITTEYGVLYVEF